MRKSLALFIILFLAIFSLAASQASEGRGVTIKLKDAGGKEISLYKESHALVIGVSNYTAGWPKLPGVKKDVEEATYRAIDDAKESLAESFPTYGYIYKTMTHKLNKKNRIAFLSLGKADGIEAGSTVDIIEFISEKDPIKGMESTVPRVLTECTVTETELFPDRSICVINGESADIVFVKHAVRTKSETGVFRGMQKIYRKVM